MRRPLTVGELALATIELAHSRIPDGASNDDDFAHGDDCIIDFVDALPLPEHERKRTRDTLLYFLFVRTYHEAAYKALDLKEHIGYLAFPPGFAERRATFEPARGSLELVAIGGSVPAEAQPLSPPKSARKRAAQRSRL